MSRAVTGLTVALALGPAVAFAQSSAAPRTVECTFGNPAYAGSCTERATPTRGQTPVQACEAVLQCLNDPRCLKAYCRATTVRGRWTLLSPKPPAKGRPGPTSPEAGRGPAS